MGMRRQQRLFYRLRFAMMEGLPYVLLTDDDADDRELFYSGMERIYPAIRVKSFSGGEEMMDFLDGCPADNLPACMVMDYKMSGMSGPLLLQVTGPRTRYGGIPKVIWSTSNRSIEIEECLRLGAVDFARKPASEKELDRFIKSL